MAVALRVTAVYNNGQAANSAGGSQAFPTSGSGGTVAAGDIAILNVGSINTTVTLTTPTGWTLVHGGDVSSTSAQSWVYAKQLVSGDIGGNFTLTFSTSMRWVAQMTVVSGGTLTGLLSNFVVETASDSNALIPSISSVPSGAFIVVGFIRRYGGTPAAAPNVNSVAGYSQGTNPRSATNYGTAPELSVEAMYKITGSAGTYGGETATVSSVSVGVDYTVAIPNATVSNTPPTANAGADLTVEPYKSLSITGTDSDSDGTVASRVWTSVSGPSVTLVNATTATVSFIPPGSIAGTSVTLRYTVTDNLGATGSDDVVVTVYPATERAVVGGVMVPMEIRGP